MQLLQVQGIGKRYRQGELEVRALADVELTVTEGEFAALVGPSGSGKTTLLNIIGGLDAPSEGKVLVNGKEITAMPEAVLSSFRLFELGFIFQAYNLVAVLTALENVQLPLERVHKFPNAKERAMVALKRFHLEAHANKRPTELSGGQCQRVAIAQRDAGTR